MASATSMRCACRGASIFTRGYSYMSEIDGSASPVLSGFRWRRLLDQLTLLVVRAGATIAKFLLAIYTARYLSLADLGIYELLVGATTIVPAVLGLGMTEWVMRKIVDLPRAQALPMIVSRLSLTLCLHLVIQPLAFLLDVLLGEPIPLPIAVISGAILMLENLGAQAADMLIARRRVFLAYWLTFLRMGFWPIPVMVIGLLYPETRTLECAADGLARHAGGELDHPVRHAAVEGALAACASRAGSFLSQNLHGSLRLYVKDVSGTSQRVSRPLSHLRLSRPRADRRLYAVLVDRQCHALACRVQRGAGSASGFIAAGQSGDRNSLSRCSNVAYKSNWAVGLFSLPSARHWPRPCSCPSWTSRWCWTTCRSSGSYSAPPCCASQPTATVSSCSRSAGTAPSL